MRFNERIAAVKWLLGLVLLFAVGAPAAGQTMVPGTPRCSDIPGCNAYWIELKIYPPVSGTYSQGGLTVTVTFSSDGRFLSWTSNLGIDAVIVKGGPNANVYLYSPEATSGTGLRSPDHPEPGMIPAISYVTFCWDAELMITKTAQGSYEKEWEWTVSKSVTPSAVEIQLNGSAYVTYTIAAGATYTLQNWQVTGTITIQNPHPRASTTVTVTDRIDGIEATVVCLGGVVLGPWPAAVTCTYSAGSSTVPQPLPMWNVANVASSHPAIGGGSASASILYTITEIDERARVVDVQDCPPGFTCTAFSPGPGPWDFTAPGGSVTFGKMVTNNSVCGVIARLLNTATLTELDTGEKPSPASAEVTIHTGPCRPPNQGCTPGYWKNHPSAWASTGYSPSQQVAGVFSRAGSDPYTSLGGKTLLEALSFQGGRDVLGAAEILLRAAVAAILNAGHPHVNYPRTVAEIVAAVNSALGSRDRATILALASALDHDNNLGCPLGR